MHEQDGRAVLDAREHVDRPGNHRTARGRGLAADARGAVAAVSAVAAGPAATNTDERRRRTTPTTTSPRPLTVGQTRALRGRFGVRGDRGRHGHRDPLPHLPAVRVHVRAADPREGRAGHADPPRPRRRVEQGLHLPEGHDARPPAPRSRPAPRPDGARRRHLARGRLGRGVRPLRGAAPPDPRARRPRRGHRVHRQPDGPQLLARPVRRPVHRPGPVPDDLLGRHRRPVAEEPVVGRSCTAGCGRSRPPTCAAPTTSS